jgi:hypothetical protein
MAAAIRAGIAYFLVVFAAGFVLGTMRVLVAAPYLGEFGAVLLELPVILAVSWFACAWLARQFNVPSGVTHRLVMGFLAFMLLMLAEAGISVFAFGRSIAEHLASYRTASAQAGLAAQVAFALFPLAHALFFSPRQGTP